MILNKASNIFYIYSELYLTGEQLSEVVNKLCRSIEDLPAEEIPPFVHQLLELCRDNYANYVFLALRNYFNNKIYKVKKNNDPDSIEDSSEVGLYNFIFFFCSDYNNCYCCLVPNLVS